MAQHGWVSAPRGWGALHLAYATIHMIALHPPFITAFAFKASNVYEGEGGSMVVGGAWCRVEMGRGGGMVQGGDDIDRSHTTEACY